MREAEAYFAATRRRQGAAACAGCRRRAGLRVPSATPGEELTGQLRALGVTSAEAEIKLSLRMGQRKFAEEMFPVAAQREKHGELLAQRTGCARASYAGYPRASG